MTVKRATQIRREPAVELADLPPLTQLQRAIYECCAPILHEPDVRAYQERMRRQSERKTWRRVFGTPLAIYCLTFLAMGIWGYALVRHAITPFLQVFGSSLWICDAVSAALVIHATVTLSRDPQMRSTWISTPFVRRDLLWAHYPNRAPSQVRQRVRAISGWCPDATFAVEYLKEDPFLIVKHKGERYYIAVWDETGFVA